MDTRCEVSVLGAQETTFEVSGHHYALVQVTGLPEGAVLDYDVRLNGDLVWPPVRDSEQSRTPGVSESGSPSSSGPSALSQSGHRSRRVTGLPSSTIRTLEPGRAQRIAFGSCRVPTQRTVEGRRKYGVDALEAYAVRIATDPDGGRPDLMVMLGDQVYADETTELTRQRIATRRDLSQPPGGEVADFEEYTWLYHESWSDPQIRWLMSTVPTAMIFDDHDVHDDWNTSRSWRADVKKTSWWSERILGGLVSYWVYQHIGNLSPDELADDAVYQRVRALAAEGEDAAPYLREFAAMADAEADGGKGYRWSFWRDLGNTRLVVIDSRCGRMLDGGTRSMLSDAEFDWVSDRVIGDYDHLLIGTSLPWLMAPAVHQVEAWSEHLAEGPGRLRSGFGEKLRRAADLEHWPAFHDSFDRLARLIADVAAGERGSRAPATVCVLSGDVHHSYVCEADVTPLMGTVPAEPSKVYQLTCSPVHNTIPGVMRLAFSVSWTRPVTRLARVLFTRPRTIPETLMRWWVVGGPLFGNAISTLVLEGRAARVVLESTRAAEPLPPRNRLTVATPGHEPDNQWALTEDDWDPARYPLDVEVARDLSQDAGAG
ncbi:alkaline phosphatase family protein [Kineosporia sp. J2-2]|uniref:Alkaline phosphatase family protein n=1 Tax=Kineosporia corallincola TaxID=2835133 RepID=A0ABS5TDS4_9ACTN|nr:alkaline phosphatase D family protein [Kineosporia corallincola]MBT0769242.1 alkaline phosphatase family protein [Kineosporia corallincola]